jgi:hypothetical protein
MAFIMWTQDLLTAYPTWKALPRMHSDDKTMGGPGDYAVTAMSAIGSGRTDEAQVHAILALAAAVNRLAAAAEALPGRPA